MAITDPLVLPSDVVLTPVEDLPVYLREQLEYEEGDYVITRPQSRTTSSIIDAQTTELLKLFQAPMTVVQAVIRFSQTNMLDPEQVLTDAFPIIQSLIEAPFLVPADSDHVQQILPSFAAGDQIAGCEVLRCVHFVEDTEVYQAKRTSGEMVALKLSKFSGSHQAVHMLKREISILKRLDGRVNPLLLETGVSKDRPYLITEWCSGIEVSQAAQELRRYPEADNRRRLLDLCYAVLDAYSHLHAQGIIHADIHPGNILVVNDGSIKIIDYGLACWKGMSEEGEPHRADVSYFSEPEYVKAMLTGFRVPAPSMKGEQFSLAALLYSLLTGAQYLTISLEREEMLQRIMTGNPLPFSRWSIKPWLEVEKLLATALSKHPEDRFPSLSAFACKLKEVVVLDEQTASSSGQHTADGDALATQELLTAVLQGLGPEGSLLPSGLTIAPTCSLTYGMAGIAYALYHIACVQHNTALLSLADIWSTKAINTMKSNTAFYDEVDITPEIIGYTSPYHTASGVYCIQALISHAMGDFVSQQEAIDAFIAVSKKPCKNRDLTLGRCGTLLAASFLLDILSPHQMLKATPLRELGNEVMQSVWDEINTLPAIQEDTETLYLGIAHGWAGFLYATLCWCQAAGSTLPHTIEKRLQQLAACAESCGQGARWKWALAKSGQRKASSYMSGWCNGSAGYIYLWALAHRILGDEIYARLAEQSAWNAWEERDTTSSLCCGLAGQAYGLLNLYKHTGERAWLTRAQELAQQAVLNVKGSALYGTATHIALDARSESLYHGNVGIAVLVADLARPEQAHMPFFEREGWSI